MDFTELIDLASERLGGAVVVAPAPVVVAPGPVVVAPRRVCPIGFAWAYGRCRPI